MLGESKEEGDMRKEGKIHVNENKSVKITETRSNKGVSHTTQFYS